MKTQLLLALTCALTLTGCKGNEESKEALTVGTKIPTIPVPAWPSGKKAALSITFDDSTSGHVHLAAPLLTTRGVRATFFLVTGNVESEFNGTTWEEWRGVHAQGHEIGSHTLTHRNLAEISADECEKELSQSKAKIEEMIPGVKCQTLSYPYGSCDTEIRTAAARLYTASRLINPFTIGKDVSLHALPSIMPAAEFPIEDLLTGLHAAFDRGDWVILTYHGITGDEDLPGDDIGYDPRPIEALVTLLDDLEKRRDELWIAPMGEIAEYIELSTHVPAAMPD